MMDVSTREIDETKNKIKLLLDNNNSRYRNAGSIMAKL
jgi:hypothetical protein